MKRRRFVALIGGALAAPLVFAQTPRKVYRLGILSAESQRQAEALSKLLHARLVELGWHLGQDLSIDLLRVDAIAGLDEHAAGLVASKPDILLALGPYAAASLKKATRSIPIVFVAVANPVERGFVSSLARPGGNVTGLSHTVSGGLGGKNAELLKELVPRAQRIAFLINPDNPVYRVGNRQETLSSLARQLRILVVDTVEARSADELPAAMEAAVRAGADGLIVHPDTVLNSAWDRIVQLAAKHRLPASYPHRGFVEGGGLMSYSTDMPAVVRRGADYVDRILKGAKPADMPVEQPTKFELAINLKTARALGLVVPQSLLLRADRVIE